MHDVVNRSNSMWRIRRTTLLVLVSGALALVLSACGILGAPGVALSLTGSTPAGGNSETLITVTGENIAGDATVEVCGAAAVGVTILDASGDPVAADAKTGVEIEFNPPELASDQTCDIVVTQEGESDTLSAAFAYVAPKTTIAVNAGGPEYVGPANTWLADTDDPVIDPDYSTGGTDAYSIDGSTEIAGTELDVLFHTERSGSEAFPSFQYDIPVGAALNGEYTVRIHYAEIYYGVSGTPGEGGGAGSRLFDVGIESANVETDYDIFVAAGDALTAVTETYVTTDVNTDDTVTIMFSQGSVEWPKLSAIEVEWVVPATP